MTTVLSFQLACGGGHFVLFSGDSSMFARANRIIWFISSFRLIPMDAALSSRIWSVSVEMRMEITSFSGFRATNFAKQIPSLLNIVSEIAIIKNILNTISNLEYE